MTIRSSIETSVSDTGDIPVTSSSVGERVRRHLRRAGRTQTDLANKLGLSQAAVSTRLRGLVALNVDELAATAELLSVTVTDLLADPDDQQADAESGATS